MTCDEMTMPPLLSVIVVTFRDLSGLRDTLSSLEPLAQQAGGALEILVQDGGTPGFEVAASTLPLARTALIQSIPDGGIYDGMNRALRRSRGRYVWFLNGGDLNACTDFGALVEVLSGTPRIILADFILDLGNRVVARRARHAIYLLHALPTSHQAIIYPGTAARRLEYDLRYRISADYAFTAALVMRGPRPRRVPLALARFAAGGTSQQNARVIALDAARVQRDILGLPWAWRAVSSSGHAMSRALRRRATSERA